MIETTDPGFRTMRDELFGPVVTAFVYDDARYADTLDLIDGGTTYGLTGAVFARDLDAIEETQDRLRYAAGNFYVNDKPTGAVVGQQPFGGARASGTNDKAGSMWNLIRWVSPRTIKETFVPPRDYRYPFLEDGTPIAQRASGLVQLGVDAARDLRRHALDALEFLGSRREHRVDRSEVVEQRPPPRRTDSLELVEERRETA